MSEEYYMIEKIIDGRAHWWMSDPTGETHWNDPCRWTTDCTKARRYESEAYALYVMGPELRSVGCMVTGHIDCDGPDLSEFDDEIKGDSHVDASHEG